MSTFALREIPLLSRSTLDRAEELRADARALKEGWSAALLLRVTERGQVRLDGAELVLDKAADFAAEPPEEAIFLGIVDGRHVWAVRSELEGRAGDLRMVGAKLDDASAGLVTTAVALLNWHASAGFSALDGSPTRPAKGGWSRISEATGHEEFPRTDPAIICLVHDGGDRALLARQHAWPETMFSILAGFVEAGESLEHCVVREIREEVGLDVREVTYLGSQPWPFPRSVMIGFSAVADPDQPLRFADGEIAEAHWFTRTEIREALERGDWTAKRQADEQPARLLLPGSISIARGIVASWAMT
ncbi:NAD(+) diphosphatase [Skermania sp. ID1734]|uniref:NAD(+) diphosphatase n=1 Tax=Skermania sp. ID1734 TaxID=2597516 RepID=UPI00117ECD5D|nr:NAD(+) diphosphatase [Skermania sp. ID1734]TSD97293.1 NAD(+) diphosphatase [Skermania sp. ID1734]